MSKRNQQLPDILQNKIALKHRKGRRVWVPVLSGLPEPPKDHEPIDGLQQSKPQTNEGASHEFANPDWPLERGRKL